MLTGRFNFSPAKIKIIPKANKPGEFRRILIAPRGTREKVVQKALQIVLNAIFDHGFSTNTYGFRPNKSLVNALEQMHLRGGHKA